MNRFVVMVAIGLAALASLHAAPQVGSDARAKELIRSLNLQVLPKESGYLGIVGRSTQIVTVSGQQLAVQSQNYYMLTRDRPINYLHWLAPDDTQILIEGGPVDYFIFSERTGREGYARHGSCWRAKADRGGAGWLLEGA
jgi:hypothetical protein